MAGDQKLPPALEGRRGVVWTTDRERPSGAALVVEGETVTLVAWETPFLLGAAAQLKLPEFKKKFRLG